MQSRTFPVVPGFIIGTSLAGFVDGIVLHQILQWHHMICIEEHCVSKTVETLERQNFTDGLFHAGMLATLFVGLILLVQNVNQGYRISPRRFWGSALLGAGVFNVVEGIIDHHILQIHHVRFGPNQPAWDYGFLGVSAVLALTGWILTREPDAQSSSEDRAAVPLS